MKRYLAHPFDTRFDMRQWELRMESNLDGLELINPFYDIDRADVLAIDEGRMERYAADPAAIVTRDIQALRLADGFCGYVNGALTYGTIMEIAYAWLWHGIKDKEHVDYPVELIVTNGHQDHPWLRFHSTAIFTSLEEYEGYLAEII